MRLIINTASLLDEESGIGVYTRQIASACCAEGIEPTFFYGYPSKRLVKPSTGGSGSWLGSLKSLVGKNSIGRKICLKAIRAVNLVADSLFPREWDCYFEPNFVFVPAIRAKHKVVTAHDFSCFRYPQWHPAARVRYMEKFFWKSLEQADCILTGSESIRQEGINMFGIPAERIIAIPDGVDHSHFYPRPVEAQLDIRKRYRLPEEYILYVGALEPRKNLVNLIEAHAALPYQIRKRYPLVLIGSQGWNNEEIMRCIRLNAKHCHFVGYVPRCDLPAFYSSSTFFAYPSWYEGFGLPALEAMACGKTVLTSTDPALMEIGADAVMHAEPSSPEDIASRMRELLEDPERRHALEQKALVNAARYSWTQSAQKHLQIFKDLP